MFEKKKRFGLVPAIIFLAACTTEKTTSADIALPTITPLASPTSPELPTATEIETSSPTQTSLPQTPTPEILIPTPTHALNLLSTIIAPPPLTETTVFIEEARLAYEPITLLTTSDQEITVYLLRTDEEPVPPIVPSGELSLPIPDKNGPASERGFFEERGGPGGHLAWDIAFSTNPGGGPVEVLPPHPDALLVAAFPNLPFGRLAEHLNASGGVEIYYLAVDDGNSITPYLFLYAHVGSDSVITALKAAAGNNGRVDSAGFVGREGNTDQKHIHLAIFKVSTLLQITKADFVLEALWKIMTSEGVIDHSIFVDPSLVLPQIKNLPKLSPSSVENFSTP